MKGVTTSYMDKVLRKKKKNKQIFLFLFKNIAIECYVVSRKRPSCAQSQQLALRTAFEFSSTEFLL